MLTTILLSVLTYGAGYFHGKYGKFTIPELITHFKAVFRGPKDEPPGSWEEAVANDSAPIEPPGPQV